MLAGRAFSRARQIWLDPPVIKILSPALPNFSLQTQKPVQPSQTKITLASRRLLYI